MKRLSTRERDMSQVVKCHMFYILNRVMAFFDGRRSRLIERHELAELSDQEHYISNGLHSPQLRIFEHESNNNETPAILTQTNV
jgi:hypothetical protein